MMTDRERLIELIRKQRELCNNENCGNCGCAIFGNYPDCQNEMLAHQLIKNGVIVPLSLYKVKDIDKIFDDEKKAKINKENIKKAIKHRYPERK